MVTTKIYKNSGKQKVSVPVLGVELKPGEQVSVTSEYHQPLVLENFPGLVELVDEEQKAEAAKAEKGKK
jgi:hypothetical protein